MMVLCVTLVGSNQSLVSAGNVQNAQTTISAPCVTMVINTTYDIGSSELTAQARKGL